MKKLRFLIHNQWMSSAEDRYFAVYNPANGQEIAKAAEATASDVEKAVEAAAKAALSWAAKPVTERCGLLLKTAELMEKRLSELAAAETEETGKPVYESEQIDLPLSIQAFRYYGERAPEILGGRRNVDLHDACLTGYVSYEPYGVAAIIAPWNFPLHLLTRDMCPALAAGNTVVVKPSSKTPVTAALLGEIMLEAGFPEGVVNIVYGSGSVAGEALVHSPQVGVIGFTGSEEVGRRIMQINAESAVLKKMVLELGGKGAICIDRDADLEGAVSSAVYGVCMNQGEVCCASSRCYVHEDIYEAFLEKAVDRMQSLVLGDPSDRRTDLGSLIDAEQLKRVDGYVKRAVSEGALVVTGGRRYDRGICALGSFYEPTILTNVTDEMECMRREIFGPVLLVSKVKDMEEAVTRANRSGYGLGAAIWSEDPQVLENGGHALQAGTVWQNHNITSRLEAPYGGIRNSGFGRQNSEHGLLEYVYVKNTMLWNGRPYFDFYRDKGETAD